LIVEGLLGEVLGREMYNDERSRRGNTRYGGWEGGDKPGLTIFDFKAKIDQLKIQKEEVIRPKNSNLFRN
jgi:hypothetical protein